MSKTSQDDERPSPWALKTPAMIRRLQRRELPYGLLEFEELFELELLDVLLDVLLDESLDVLLEELLDVLLDELPPP